MAEVRFVDVSKSYGSNPPTIPKLNLQIRDGEFMVLVGPSGCGKSTTLRMVAGLEDVSGGEVFIGDRLVNDVAPKDRDIAMVFQNYALYPHMNVRENMAFGLKLRKFDRAEIAERVDEAAALLEITELLDRKPKELSGGQRQRVALGRAIVRKPTVFLFDEPLSNLDAKLRVQMRTEIKKLHRRLKTTMIYVTHDQVEAMTMGDRITVMKDGVIHQVAAPVDLYREPVDTFVASFIGSPGMNFIDVSVSTTTPLLLDEGSFTLAVPSETSTSGNGGVALEAMLELHRGRSLTLGIRPEHVRATPEACLYPARVLLRHEVSEMLGNEMYLYLRSERHRITGRSTVVRQHDLDEEIPVYFDMSEAHFFDPANGLRLA
ncbi:MAG: sn-glycerol-3-phosphate ABC transporter ATP-binding protein UgpC [Bacteroidota bacterium]|nr:sn-glycerol-3-phosphate ABC transporter ATP-binding protein UgpC [Bacteroidota bacterium]